MDLRDELGRFSHRVSRDLQAPMVLLMSEHPVRSVVTHRGFDQTSTLRTLVSSNWSERQGVMASDTTVGFRSSAVAPVFGPSTDHDLAMVGTLVIADRRRRWFCPDELHHLDLLASGAYRLIVEDRERSSIDVRSGRRRKAVPATL